MRAGFFVPVIRETMHNRGELFSLDDDMVDVVLPLKVMARTIWTHSGAKFTDAALFSEAVRQDQIQILGKDCWQPQEEVLPVPRVTMHFFHWSDNDEELESTVEIVGANGRAILALELLFQAHNAVVELVGNDDHHFFEGLHLMDAPAGAIQPPIQPHYMLHLGS